jgi:DNA transposition AAA+ family ATPase
MKSHPEPEDRGEESKTPTIYPCNKTIRERLTAKREEPVFSNKVIARRIGMSDAVISQYLNDDGCLYSGDIPKLELKIVEFLENDARRVASGIENAKCSASEQIRQAVEYIRKTSDIGLVLDGSGGGKTRGMQIYAGENSLAVLYRTFSWSCTKNACESFVFRVAGKDGYDGRTPRTEHSVTKFCGQQRPFLVDDAHFLHYTALKWWIDFAEATQSPLILGGTFKLLEMVERDPQIFSRIGLRFEINKTDKEGNLAVDRELIRHMVDQLLPQNSAKPLELIDLCAKVAEKHGHYRSLHKQLKVAVEIKAGTQRTISWAEAFRDAHTMLVRNYEL